MARAPLPVLVCVPGPVSVLVPGPVLVPGSVFGPGPGRFVVCLGSVCLFPGRVLQVEQLGIRPVCRTPVRVTCILALLRVIAMVLLLIVVTGFRKCCCLLTGRSARTPVDRFVKCVKRVGANSGWLKFGDDILRLKVFVTGLLMLSIVLSRWSIVL